jgi:hypothetical protein
VNGNAHTSIAVVDFGLARMLLRTSLGNVRHILAFRERTFSKQIS